MAKKAPLQIVNDEHGSKEKLVDALVGKLDRGEDSKDEFRDRLLAAPNSKLLRMHRTMTEIDSRFGGTDKLVDSLVTLQSKAKDADYRDKVSTYTPVRLLSLHRDAEKRSRKAAR